jgi:hypothetical protein
MTYPHQPNYPQMPGMPPMPSTPPMMPMRPPPRSWWSRNWKWFVPVGCLLPIFLCGGGITGLVFFGLSLIKSSEPYQHAMTEAKGNSAVVANLGEPVEPRLLPNGSVNLHNDAGDADLIIPVRGSKGTGKMHIVGIKSAGKWTYSQLDFTPDDGKPTVNLLKPSPTSAP